MGHHLGGDVRRAREAVGDVLRRGEDAARLAEADAVEALHLPAERPVGRRFGELAELRAVELVRLAELVQQPDDLVRMAHAVRRELRRDHHVDRAAVRFGQVGEPPEERLAQHARARVPLERERDDVGLVAAPAKLRGRGRRRRSRRRRARTAPAGGRRRSSRPCPVRPQAAWVRPRLPDPRRAA